MARSKQETSFVLRSWVFVAASLSFAHAETDVSGALETGRWTESESPYHVTGELRVPEGTTLTIESGVTISFDPGVAMVVRGTLEARGTSDKQVVFGRQNSGREWGGVACVGPSARARFEHVEFTGASNPVVDRVRQPAAFNLVEGAKGYLAHCWFHGFGVPIVESNEGSELVLLDSLIEDGREGIHSSRGYARVERVHVRDIFGYSDCIDYDFESTPQSVIRDCLVEKNEEDDGIDLGSAPALVDNVVIRDIRAGKAVSIDGEVTPVLRGVLIYDCKQGIVVKDSSTPVMSHVTITRCERGVDCYQKVSGQGGGHGTGDSMIVWGNDAPVVLDAHSTFDMTFSMVAGGYPGEGNLDFDPLFVEPSRNDFHLVPGSPAIAAGKDGQDMGAYGSVEPSEGSFLRADANGDGAIDVSDAITILLHLFRRHTPTPCLDALDAQDNGTVNVSDAVFVLRFVLSGGPAPPPPYPVLGVDPTGGDDHDCTTAMVYFR